MMQLFRILLSISIVILLLSCSKKGPNADIEITNINVVDVKEGRILENRTVHIKDDSIISTTHPPGNSNITIDGSGKYLMPGLWDFHAHFRGGDTLIAENRHLLNLHLANGITTVRDAGGDLAEAVLRWRDQVEAGIMTGPKIFTSGPKFDGSDPTWAGSIELTDTSQVSAAIDSLMDMEVDFVKLYDSTIPPEVYLEAIKQAEDAELPVTGHMPYSVNFRDAVDRGLDASEHMYYIFKGGSLREKAITEKVKNGELTFGSALSEVRDSYNPNYARKTFSYMADHETGVVPTLHIMKVLGNLTEKDHSSDEYLNYIGEGIQRTYQGRIESAKQRSDEATNIYKDLLENFKSMIVPMHEAGVTIYAGSDSGPFNSFVYPGLALHKELALLVEAGLTPAQALRSATIHPASFFGMENRSGQIKKGYEADMVLLEKNPLEDINHTQTIHTIILDGKHIIDEERRQNLLRIDGK